jgi:hypothetical protein
MLYLRRERRIERMNYMRTEINAEMLSIPEDGADGGRFVRGLSPAAGHGGLVGPGLVGLRVGRQADRPNCLREVHLTHSTQFKLIECVNG